MSFFQKIKGNKKVVYSIIGSVCALSLIVAITVPVALNSKSQNSITSNNQNFEVMDYKSNYEPYNNLFNFDSLKNKNISEIDKSLIESTINQNNANFFITILDHIVKNNDLNFVTFYYRLADKQKNVPRKDFVFSKTIFLDGQTYEKNVKEISWEKFDQIAIQNGSKTKGVQAYLDSNYGKTFINSVFGLEYDIPNSKVNVVFKPDIKNNMLQSTFTMFELAKQTMGDSLESTLHNTGIAHPFPSTETNKNPSTTNLVAYVDMPISAYSDYDEWEKEGRLKETNLLAIPFGIFTDKPYSYMLNIAKKDSNYKYFEINNNKYFELFISNVELYNINKKETTNLPINKKLYIDVTSWNLNGL